MYHFTEKYIDTFTDYGFEKIFDEKNSKDVLQDFLNELLREKEGEIKSIVYLNNKYITNSPNFDVLCKNNEGEEFIVEIQKSKHKFYPKIKEYYSNFPIRKEAYRANWNLDVKKIYTIAILDFNFEENDDTPQKYKYEVQLTNTQTNDDFYEKMTFVYICMPKFNKTIDQLETKLDKWIYLLKNLHNIENINSKFQNEIFMKLFRSTEIKKLSQEQIMLYEASLRDYRDLNNCIETARQDGLINALKQNGVYDAVIKMIKTGFKTETICKISGLSEDELNLIN